MSKIDPLDDFDEFVNGEWMTATNIPDDQIEWGSFHILREQNNDKIKNILEKYASDNTNKYNVIGKIYKNLLENIDCSIIKTKIIQYLSLIDMVNNTSELGRIIGMLAKLGIDTFFNLSTSEDPMNPQTVKLTISSVDLSLPDKNYYNNEKFSKYTTGFKKMLYDLFHYFGYSPEIANQYTEDVYLIEDLIACSLKSAADRREYDKLYFNKTLSEFIEQMLNIKKNKNKETDKLWTNIFNSANIKNITGLVGYDISYFRKITFLLQFVPIDKIKNYLKYLVIKELGSILISDVDIILFNFFGNILNGKPKISKRSTQIIDFLGSFTSIGEILGSEYSAIYSDEESLNIVNQMINNIRQELHHSISNCTWMESHTKEKALIKLKTFKQKIGHQTKNTDNINIKKSDHISLILRLNGYNQDCADLYDQIIKIRSYEYQINILDLIDKPVDPDKWYMNTYEVNAYYSPQRNEIVFPDGLLQEPFFSKNQNMFKNYGALGAIIGHEIIHGYDDQGRKYDHMGMINNWWTKTDLKKFNIIADKMVNQYEKYSINGQNIDGKLTLGENLADLGGIIIALNTVLNISDKSNNIQNMRDFFISYANVWKKISRPDKILSALLSDPHSPAKYRIHILKNIDEFYQAFGSNDIESKKMYIDPQDRIKLF
jgi:predicted metalloendopeptidase